MCQSVHRMLMPLRVLRNPTIPTPPSQHKTSPLSRRLVFRVRAQPKPANREILTPSACPHKRISGPYPADIATRSKSSSPFG